MSLCTRISVSDTVSKHSNLFWHKCFIPVLPLHLSVGSVFKQIACVLTQILTQVFNTDNTSYHKESGIWFSCMLVALIKV